MNWMFHFSKQDQEIQTIFRIWKKLQRKVSIFFQAVLVNVTVSQQLNYYIILRLDFRKNSQEEKRFTHLLFPVQLNSFTARISNKLLQLSYGPHLEIWGKPFLFFLMARTPNGDFQRDAVDEHHAPGLSDCEAHQSKLLLPAMHQCLPASARGCQSPCYIGQ